MIYRAVLLTLAIFLLAPALATAANYYEYDCEDNNISNSNFSSGAVACSNSGTINGSYVIEVAGGTTYSSLDLTSLSLPANYNITMYTYGSSSTVPAGSPSGMCPSNSNASNACYSAGGGMGIAYDDATDPAFQNLKTGASAGGTITTITQWRWEQIGSTTYVYRDGTSVDNWAKTPIVFQLFSNAGAGFDYYVDNICIYTGDYAEECFVSPSDPNGTLTVQAVDALNSTLIHGLCANLTNTSHSFSSCNSTSTDVYFTGNQNNISTGVYNVSVYSVGIGDGNASATYSTNTSLNVNWSATQTEQVDVLPLGLVLNFLDEESRDSMNGTNVSVSVISSNGSIFDYSTDTGDITITGIFAEGDYTVRYTAENYSLRDFYFTLSFDDPTQIETLYLLRQSVYTPGVVSVKNFDGTNVEGAEVFMNRYYGNDTIPNQVQSGTTDKDGNTVFVAESVTAFYTFSATLDGVSRYNESVPQLLTVDNTGLFYKTIVLQAQGTDVTDPYTGFQYNFTPQQDLYMNTSYNFSGSLLSTNWALVNCSYTLYYTNNTVIGQNNSFCGNNSGSASISYTPVGITQFYAEIVVNTALFTNTYQQLYNVINGSRGNFTMVDLTDDLSNFSGGGFNNFGKFAISLLVIMMIVLGVSTRSNFVNNPEEILWLVFILSLGFSYIDWMNLNNPLMPIQALNQWFIAIVLGFMASFASLRKWGSNE